MVHQDFQVNAKYYCAKLIHYLEKTFFFYNPKCDHLTFRLGLVKELLERFHTEAPKPTHGRPSKDPQPSRLTERHFVQEIPPTEKKARPQRRCVVCNKHGRRRDTSVLVPRL